MAKGVSGYTHTRQQLNDYANQHNPNNPAYWANQKNRHIWLQRTVRMRSTIGLNRITATCWKMIDW